ncbi:helix-turn-helix domain-containing protein [Flavilitoribacter nigricans]|uniref:HTH araC/xylS-type domain-containing protein n=1 Tax=Flavilitoribacter nigricans (strain ATCC 23147 / DSM 23189 / NBRC 102662 / NCIMB 1420 / SS-2) TaxID=1122177 RepID=A0A2D0NEF2_FLAN2|nr:helix-turn-helix transcriptional regulator [Flavilitoribacter nigricans]PHN06881.1 hypothetical protein CRP01_09165 [Flavilitoribacter nigricans DSM 23189 = NBRC 102662]
MEITAPSLDTWTSVFLLAAGQGLFLAALLFQKYRRGQFSNSWLAALILAFSLLLIFNVSFWTRYNWEFPPFNLIYPAVAYLIGPFLLFYLDGLAASPRFTKYRWVHFLLPGIVLSLMLPAYFQPLSTLQTEMQDHQLIVAPLHRWGLTWLISAQLIMAHLLLYAVLVFWYSRRILNDGHKRKGRMLVSRVNLLRSLFSLYTLAFVSYYILVRMAFFRIEHDYLISLVMAGAIYCIGYREYSLAGPTADREVEKPSAAKYSTSSLTPGALVSIAERLEAHMEQYQPYRDNELRLNDLADKLDISPHHLSQAVNEHYGKTFNQFINEYRIEEAKTLLASEAHRQTYIIEIAYQVGFNNKTTFNQAFKHQTGMSPSKWRNGLAVGSGKSDA